MINDVIRLIYIYNIKVIINKIYKIKREIKIKNMWAIVYLNNFRTINICLFFTYI